MRSSLVGLARRAALVSSRRAVATHTTSSSATAFLKAMSARPNGLSHTRYATTKGPDFAVDAPDGEHDLHEKEEHGKAVEKIIEYAATHENAEEIEAAHAAGKPTAFAVDAPDGEHDLEDLEEHGKVVEEIIDYAASHENPEEIKEHQRLEKKTRVEAEKHQEHDW